MAYVEPVTQACAPTFRFAEQRPELVTYGFKAAFCY